MRDILDMRDVLAHATPHAALRINQNGEGSRAEAGGGGAADQERWVGSMSLYWSRKAPSPKRMAWKLLAWGFERPRCSVWWNGDE